MAQVLVDEFSDFFNNIAKFTHNIHMPPQFNVLTKLSWEMLI